MKYKDRYIRWLFVLGISLITLIGFSQNGLSDIDLNRVPQKKIRNFIDAQLKNHVSKFCDVEASWQEGQDINQYRQLESIYIIKDSPEKVWSLYKTVSPADSWNGKIISFGLLFSTRSNFIMYRNDNNFSEIDTGQVFYVNLKILKGIYNLAVGLEIVSIDNENKSIVFSYIKGGKSQGEQTVHFVRTEEGYTKIIHSTAFKSDSRFRDRFLYPFFHRKAINEFHRNILNSLMAENKLSSLGNLKNNPILSMSYIGY